MLLPVSSRWVSPAGMMMMKMVSGGSLCSWGVMMTLLGGSLLLSTSTSASTPAELSSGNTDFASRLYQALARRTDDNVFLSPLSVSAALALLAAGSAGATQQQLLAALSLDSLEPNEIPGSHLTTRGAVGVSVRAYEPTNHCMVTS